MASLETRIGTLSSNGIKHNSLGLEVFATCPSSAFSEQATYLDHVKNVARWSDQIGCRGILVYTDNSLVDPWLVSQIILENTETLCPLVAIQPVYMHPYAVAKMISTYGYLFGRRVFLNMVAGGFKNDLVALNDQTPHDKRYDRLVEYTLIIKKLLLGDGPVTFDGEFYQVKNLQMTPRLAPELFPGILISGSSDAGMAAAKAIGATPVEYPAPPSQCSRSEELGSQRGLRVGIIARQDPDEAWRIAEERFPPERKGQLTHQLAMKVSDSKWHQQLSDVGDQLQGKRDTYWLVPFQNYKTFCPYLVGSYEEVAAELGRYMQIGYRTFILDIPPNEVELQHIGTVFSQAAGAVTE